MDHYLGWSETSEDDGRCRRHPSAPPHGICPICLRDRLSLLCPDCASARTACSCHPPTTPTTSSQAAEASSSSNDHAAVGTVAPMSYFISAEPCLRRSRSAAVPFRRAAPRPSDLRRCSSPPPVDDERPRFSFPAAASYFRFFRWGKGKRRAEPGSAGNVERLDRSRSVGASCPSEPAMGWKGRGWHFPSPIKAFRLNKAERILQQRSPLCRG